MEQARPDFRRYRIVDRLAIATSWTLEIEGTPKPGTDLDGIACCAASQIVQHHWTLIDDSDPEHEGLDLTRGSAHAIEGRFRFRAFERAGGRGRETNLIECDHLRGFSDSKAMVVNGERVITNAHLRRLMYTHNNLSAQAPLPVLSDAGMNAVAIRLAETGLAPSDASKAASAANHAALSALGETQGQTASGLTVWSSSIDQTLRQYGIFTTTTLSVETALGPNFEEAASLIPAPVKEAIDRFGEEAARHHGLLTAMARLLCPPEECRSSGLQPTTAHERMEIVETIEEIAPSALAASQAISDFDPPCLHALQERFWTASARKET